MLLWQALPMEIMFWFNDSISLASFAEPTRDFPVCLTKNWARLLCAITSLAGALSPTTITPSKTPFFTNISGKLDKSGGEVPFIGCDNPASEEPLSAEELTAIKIMISSNAIIVCTFISFIFNLRANQVQFSQFKRFFYF